MLERGVADAITFPWGSTMLFGIDKVVKYHMDAPLYVTTFVWVMNKAKYDALSPAQKKVIDNHCTTEWAEKIATPWADFEANGREKLRTAPGHEVDPLTPEQLACLAQGGPAFAGPMGGQRAQGWRRSGQGARRPEGESREVQRRLLSAARMSQRPSLVARLIGAMELFAAWLLAAITALTFTSVILRYAFNWSIPDSFDVGRNLLGIAIFWGIALAAYRGEHITVDLLWGALGPRARRAHGCFRRDRRAALPGRVRLGHGRQGAEHLSRQRAHLRPASAGVDLLRCRVGRPCTVRPAAAAAALAAVTRVRKQASRRNTQRHD